MATRRVFVSVIAFALVAACGPAAAPAGSSTSSQPAATPTAAGPTATPAATPTQAPTPSPTVAVSMACDHPYYPLRKGAKWTTNNGPGQTIPTEVTEVVANGADAAASVKQTNPSGSTFTFQVLCTAEGLAYGDGHYVGTDGKEGTRTRTAGSGVFLPAAATLADGLKFKWMMVGAYDMPAYDNSGAYKGRLTYTVELNQDCAVKGPVDVKLKTGAATGYQVTCTGTNKSTGSDGKVFQNPSPIDFYYLKGIGPSGVQPGTELVSYSIPPA
jgi:hypothetical protein